MAECHCDQPGCEHCGRVEPDGYAPETPQGPRPRYNIRGAIVGYDVTTTAPDDLPSSGCLVRDLADAIRAIALARGTESPIDVVIQSALALVRRVGDSHGCDVCGPRETP